MKFTLLALGLALAASPAAYGQDAANAPLAPQTTPQTATPHQQVEQSIRDFAASVTQPQQFGFTTSFVPGANPKGASERSWKAHWEESLGNATFSIKDVKTTFAGADKAASRVRYTLQTPLFASAPYEETLFLLRVAAPTPRANGSLPPPTTNRCARTGPSPKCCPWVTRCGRWGIPTRRQPRCAARTHRRASKCWERPFCSSRRNKT